MSSMLHEKDSDCTVGEDGQCSVCGVTHTNECPECHGRGFHTTECPDNENNWKTPATPTT